MTAPRPIPTPASLPLLGRRTGRRVMKIETVRSRLRKGQLLCREYRDGRPLWCLSDGSSVSGAIAEIVIRDPSVRPAPDGLFPGLGQTWRYHHDN